MKQFKRVLAALDMGAKGDEVTAGSRKALERALWIARRVGASLTVFHSETPDEYWDPETHGFVPGGIADSDRRGLVEKALAGISTEGVETDVVIRSGSAWLAIVHEVLRQEIDVVLAGKRTQIHSDDRRLGAVARKLLRKCPCAVWLEDPRESRDPSVILAATDLTPVGDRVVDLSASVASALGAELHVVHAFSMSMEAQHQGGEARRRYERQKCDEAIAQIERLLSTTPMAGAAGIHVGLTSPTQAVLEGVARLRPGLVVMGTVSRGGIPGLLMGNTAERLIDRIDCALLTVKPKDFVCPVALGQPG
jgi:universal stress protein E